jgi:hypothetical protein
LARRFRVSVVQLLVMLLVLLAAYPNVSAAFVVSTNESVGLSVSSGTVASFMTQPFWHCDWWNYTLCYPYYYSGYYNWWSYSYGYYPYYYSYYYPTTTVEKTKTFELKVQTSPPGVAAVNGGGTYDQGNVASFSLSSLIVPVSSGERYVFSYWSGDFSGSTPSGTVTIDSAKTVIANYQVEYSLKVSVDPPGIAATVGDGWYRSGESVDVGTVPPSISGGDGIRYVFQHWTVDDVPVSGNPAQVTMDAQHTIVARYKTQYLLTLLSDYGVVQGRGWYDAGSSATYSVTMQVDTSYGVKQVFDRWTGDVESTSAVGSITMDAPHRVAAVWRTDSTILYATVALGIVAAFALGTGLVLFALMMQRRAQLAQASRAAPPKPVATVEASSQEDIEAAAQKKRFLLNSRRIQQRLLQP